MEKEEKRPLRFSPGVVVELAHERKGFGYLVAHFSRPKSGKFFRLVTKVYDAPVPDESLALLQDAPQRSVWLNCHRLLGREGPVEFRKRPTLLSFSAPKPKWWFGPEQGPITIEEADGRTWYEKVQRPFDVLEREMEERSYEHKVLWLPDAIVSYLFDCRPLRWSIHKKY